MLFKIAPDIIIERARETGRPFIFELLRQANMHHIPSKEMPGLTYENYFVARLNGKKTLATNVMLIERLVRFSEEIEREVASPFVARALLGITQAVPVLETRP